MGPSLIGSFDTGVCVLHVIYISVNDMCLALHKLFNTGLYMSIDQISLLHFLTIQPENMVLKDGTSKHIKIIDFGTARDLSVSRDVKVMVGTPEFIGKEVL